MSWKAAFALSLTLCAATVAGVWTVSAIKSARNRPPVSSAYSTAPFTTAVTEPAIGSPAAPAPAPVSASAAQGTARKAVAPSPSRAPRLVLSETLVKEVKPLLSSGADPLLAAEGFRTATEFATVAQAAYNTGVPFMLLKHRVLNERQTPARAIERSKPHLNSVLEAQLALAEARVVVAYSRPPRA